MNDSHSKAEVTQRTVAFVISSVDNHPSLLYEIPDSLKILATDMAVQALVHLIVISKRDLSYKGR